MVAHSTRTYDFIQETDTVLRFILFWIVCEPRLGNMIKLLYLSREMHLNCCRYFKLQKCAEEGGTRHAIKALASSVCLHSVSLHYFSACLHFYSFTPLCVCDF